MRPQNRLNMTNCDWSNTMCALWNGWNGLIRNRLHWDKDGEKGKLLIFTRVDGNEAKLRKRIFFRHLKTHRCRWTWKFGDIIILCPWSIEIFCHYLYWSLGLLKFVVIVRELKAYRLPNGYFQPHSSNKWNRLKGLAQKQLKLAETRFTTVYSVLWGNNV